MDSLRLDDLEHLRLPAWTKRTPGREIHYRFWCDSADADSDDITLHYLLLFEISFGDYKAGGTFVISGLDR